MALLTLEKLKAELANLEEKIFDKVMEEVEKMFDEIEKGGLGLDLSKLKSELRGEIGLQGIQGVPGLPGSTGPIGLTGPVGPQGISGLQGPQGIQGIPGAPGLKGDKGDKGIDGKDGSSDIPEQIVAKLESLNGEKRLDASAIKNLISLIKKYGRTTSTFGGGGGMGEVLSERFQVNSSTTSVTVTRDITQNGNAVWVNYNGQSIFRGLNFTVSGRVFTLTFTPVNDSEITITYIT